jgi:hypothetical protein
MREFAKTVWLLTFVIIAVTPVVAMMQSSLRASASIAPPDNLAQAWQVCRKHADGSHPYRWREMQLQILCEQVEDLEVARAVIGEPDLAVIRRALTDP